MPSPRRFLVPLTAALLVAGMAGSVTAHVQGKDPITLANGVQLKHGTNVPIRTINVTLITGDTVRMDVYADGHQSASLVAPDGSSGQPFSTRTIKGDTFVVPEVAEPYLAAGLLDQRLFHVSDLIEHGYHDGKRQLPLILTYATDGNPERVRQRLAEPAPAGSAKTAVLPSITGVAVKADHSKRGEFWRAVTDPGQRAAFAGGITKIWLDGQVKASLEGSVPQIGAPQAWASGYDGTGVTVAVLDTGIDASHPDLAGKVVEAKNFSEAATVEDKVGHGTHVAATVAGSGAASGATRKGVAPGAKLISGKVLDDEGGGYESDIIAGMEWAAGKARVVSMSLGTYNGSNGKDPVSDAVNTLSASTGTLFVAAAGNHPPGDGFVSAPAAADAALAVGAVDRSDKLASFSNVGPRVGDAAVKPEITAPGVGIAAARAKGTSLGQIIDDNYTRLSGTSMATPHVSGAAAIVAQRNPDWRASQLKSALTSTAKPTDGLTAYQQGSGRVEVAEAVSQRIVTDSPALSFGYFTGPYGQAEPVTRKLVYRNFGDTDVTLDLALSASSVDGKPAPAGMLAPGQATVTIPAGGATSVAVTLNINVGDFGVYHGTVVATQRDGSASLRTPVGFHKDLKHKLTVRGIARDGRPAAEYSLAQVWNLDTGKYLMGTFVSGRTEILVSPGTYQVSSFIPTLDATYEANIEYTAVLKDEVAVNADTTVVLDARGAKEIQTRTKDRTDPVVLSQSLMRAIGTQRIILAYYYGRLTDRLFAVPTKVNRGEFELNNRLWLEAPPIQARVVNPDTVLHLDYLGPLGRYAKRVDGHHRLPLAYVGGGTPEEFVGRDVRGKIALIQQSDKLSPAEQVRNAAKVRAAVAIVFGAKPGRFVDHLARDLPIPGLELSNAEGRRLLDLLERAPVTLDLRGTAVSPFQYHLALPTQGGIPDLLVFQLDQTNLATVRNHFHAVMPNQVGMYAMMSFRPYDFFGFSPILQVPFPLDQIRYFSANGTTYGGSVRGGWLVDQLYFPFSEPMEPGSIKETSWFRGPFTSGISEAMVPVMRNDDRILLNFAEFLDSEPDHLLLDTGEDTEARVYRDGEEVLRLDHAVGWQEIGAEEPATYRVELDVRKGRPGWAVGNESYTNWTFHSARPPAGQYQRLPVVIARWNLGVDLNNAAPAGQPFELELHAGTQPDATPVPIRSASAWVSFNDGGTWEEVDLAAGAGVFKATIQHPNKVDSSGFVSLRIELADQQGNRLEQTLIRAYALR